MVTHVRVHVYAHFKLLSLTFRAPVYTKEILILYWPDIDNIFLHCR